MEISQMAWGSGGTTMNVMMMIEQAKEELEIMEAQHPNRFEYLKLELKSFIFLLQSQSQSQNQNMLLLSNNNSNNNMVASPNSVFMPPSSSASTQASSTSKKRKKGTSEMGRIVKQSKQKTQRADFEESFYGRRRDRVEVAIERAQACLQKIQEFKTSF